MNDLRPFERKTGNRNGEDLRLNTAVCRRGGLAATCRPPYARRI